MYAAGPTHTLVVGCGNLIRGDDAAGPVLVRLLAERGVPTGVRLIDGGTAGMDVAFAMRGAQRVVVVDASRVGVPPGTVHRVPGEVLADLEPPQGGLHAFRWDQALGFAQWLLKDEYPDEVTVWLVEGESFEAGAPLTPAVAEAVAGIAEAIVTELTAGGTAGDGAGAGSTGAPGAATADRADAGDAAAAAAESDTGSNGDGT